MMIDHIKQAVFAAEELLNWTPDQPGHLYRSVSLLQNHYNDAVTQWRTAHYPQTEVVSLAWITGKSAAEAGLLWLQEISLAIESLQRHERENGKPLSESEGFELIREALRDWYGYTPTKPEVAAMRMQFMARLTIEATTIGDSTEADEWEEAIQLLRSAPRRQALAIAIKQARFGLTVQDAIEIKDAFPEDHYKDNANSVRGAVVGINTTWGSQVRCYIKRDEVTQSKPYKLFWRNS